MHSNITTIIYNLTHNIMDWFILIEKYLNHRVLPDKLYLSLLYKNKFGKKLNWQNPKTFTEKLQWLKLYNRKPEYTIYVDKYKVREYIAETIGEKYLIPLLGVWDNPDEIDFDKLPNQFVLKCNHDSGTIFFAESHDVYKHKFDKEVLNRNQVINLLKKQLKKDYYISGREWPYKNVKRKVIAEKYIASDEPIVEYKWYCFHGKPIFCERIYNQKSNGERIIDGYDSDWNLLDYQEIPVRNSGKLFSRPSFLYDMLRISNILSKDIVMVRVDFISCNNRIYVGELTFFETSGFIKFNPNCWDRILGSYIKLPTDKVNLIQYKLPRKK